MRICGGHTISSNTSDQLVSKLVAQIVSDSGLKRSAFVQTLGYKNLTKGSRNLDRLLHGNLNDQWCLKRVQEVYGRRKEFEKAFLEAARIEKEQRKEEAHDRLAHEHFEPYIYVNHSLNTPTSITAAAFSGARWRYLDIPQHVRERSEEAQLGWVSWRVRRHFKESRGKLLLFGDITGYEWVTYPDARVSLDIRGKCRITRFGVFRVGGPGLVYKNKSIEVRRDGSLNIQPK
ncbi:MAG TPA: hypothetical protein VM554_01105 [Acidisarcina sp.]|nr:hypothetical protein [Acidisarcina sp.]